MSENYPLDDPTEDEEETDEESEAEKGHEETDDEGDDEVALADVLPIMQLMCEYMGELVEAVKALSKPAAAPGQFGLMSAVRSRDTEPPPKSQPKPKKKKSKPPSKWGHK